MIIDYSVNNLAIEIRRTEEPTTTRMGTSRLIKKLLEEEKTQEKDITIKENIIVGGLKHFLNHHRPEILSGHYLNWKGTAEAIFKQGMEVYNRVLLEGYSLDKHLSEKEIETLFMFITQASHEYLPYIKNKEEDNK